METFQEKFISYQIVASTYRVQLFSETFTNKSPISRGHHDPQDAEDAGVLGRAGTGNKDFYSAMTRCATESPDIQWRYVVVLSGTSKPGTVRHFVARTRVAQRIDSWSDPR